MKTKKLVQLSLLTAIALSIFIVELQIPNPFPFPGIKLGLANIVTLYVIYRYRAKEALLVLMARIILGSLFSGNLMAIMYSLAGGICCGGICCFVVMSVLHDKIEEKYIFIVSILGACAHNIGQIIIAIFITKTLAIMMYLPWLLLSAMITGLFIGLCTQYLLKSKAILMQK